MEQKTVVHGGYKVVVAEADVRAGMHHTILLSEGVERKATTTEEIRDKLIAVYTYSACIAATVSHEGFDEWPVPFETFARFPELFVIEWERAAYEANPHWVPRQPEETEEKRGNRRRGKKRSTAISSGGSSDSLGPAVEST